MGIFLKLSILVGLATFSQCWSAQHLSPQRQIEKDLFHIAEVQNGGYGYKTANLQKLKSATDQYNERHPANQYKLNVPKFTGIPSDFVVETINTLAHVNLVEIYNSNPSKFLTEFNKILSKIDNDDAVKIMNDKMSGELLNFLNECTAENQKIMVRSTGREDTQKMANAGGNETIANVNPNNQPIWSAMVQVLLSYFSDKSINQQKLGKIIPQDLPEDSSQQNSGLYLPVLLQVMVGETATSGIPTSGVLFSEDPETHVFGSHTFTGISVLDFTYGHCEAVVNSLLPTDQLHIDDSGIMYPHFVTKETRMVPDPSISGNLITVANDKTMIDKPSLDKSTALVLKSFGNYLERTFYGYPVDIEFVVLGKQIHIVQSRPITYDTQTFHPSYLDSDIFEAINPETGTIGKVIGAGHKETRVVLKKNIRSNFRSSR